MILRVCSGSLALAALLTVLSIMQDAAAHGVAKPPVLTPEQRERLDAASSDVYFPPEDDRLTEAQILDFLRAVDKAEEIERVRALRQLKTLRVSNRTSSPRGAGVQRAGFGSNRLNLGAGSNGSASACGRVSFRLAQADAVKTLGGNWAEFDWVQRNLVQMMSIDKIAGVSHDSVTEHNLTLFREHRDRILAALQQC